MRIETLSLRLRHRPPVQAAELGISLCREHLGEVWRSFAVVALPVTTVALATSEIAGWLPFVILFLIQPWLDRTILFVLSRAAFGQTTTPGDLWRARRMVWWRHLWLSLSIRRLSPWRAITEPVYLLEGLPVNAARRRAVQVRRRQVGAGLMVMHTFAVAELCLTVALLSFVFWFAPQGTGPDVADFLLDGRAGWTSSAMFVAYAVSVFFIEPFHVAAGFALYLNRRTELEAWDIEQEFRRAFAA